MPAVLAQRDALLRTILERPDDDTPRLVYADHLDGDDTDGSESDRARAEFIRVQCELASLPIDRDNGMIGINLRMREWELYPTPAHGWHGGLQAIVSEGNRLGDHIVFSRGFVAEVRLTLTAFLGGPCERCGGNGTIERRTTAFEPEGRVVGWDDCDSCEGEGRTEGLAKAIFSAHPVTRMVLNDQSPNIVNIHDGTDRFVFYRWPVLDRAAGRPILPGYLPSEIWESDHISTEFFPGTRQGIAFTSSELAHASLSDACVGYGRELAGLPPLASQPA